MPPHSVTSAALTGYAELATQLGLDLESLARDTETPLEAFHSPDLRIPAGNAARLYALAAERSGDESFGLRLASQRDLSNWGAVGLVIQQQPTLGGALEAVRRFIGYQNEAARLALSRQGEVVELRAAFAFQVDSEAYRQSIELAVAILHRNLRTVTGPAWRPLAVSFRHGPPRSLALHRRVFETEVAFNQSFDGLLCAVANLELPIPGADPLAAARLETVLLQQTDRPEESLADRVRELIAVRLPYGGSDRAVVARALGLSLRTLQRRLADEGVSFAGLLDEMRSRLARRYLETSSRSLSEIADLLGYSSQAAFTHWYVTRHGEPPRARRLAGPRPLPSQPTGRHNRETAGR